MPLIETEGLAKTYRRFEKEPGLKGSMRSLFKRKFVQKTAVCGFDMAIEKGEFVGLIGPNGAGKTTLIKMLTGIIAPTSGRVSVLGYEPGRLENALKMQYALVMGQKSQMFFELTSADTFRLFQHIYEIPEDAYKKNLGYFAELFGVEHLLNVQVRTLSLGERMKMELIAALLHNPGILFLDEPTIGLDAVAQRQIRAFLGDVNRQRGTTILLTSHYMEDIRSLCPRSIVIGGGKKVYDGSTAALFEGYQTHKQITALFDREFELAPPQGARVVFHSPQKVVLMVEKGRCGQVLSCLAQSAPLADVSVADEDIGEVVERIYRAGGAQS